MDGRDHEFHYFNPHKDIVRQHHVLPHWEQNEVTYFVTFRLADSIPQSKLGQWKAEREAWMAIHPPPWTSDIEEEYHQRFSKTIEHWLDQGYGACPLREPECARIVDSALNFFEDNRSIRHASVVMPNHIHILFTPIKGHRLSDILHSWKSFTANKINPKFDTQGTLWQRTYFDRIVRSSEHFENCVRYIRRNPEKAALKPQEYLHFESEWVRSLEI